MNRLLSDLRVAARVLRRSPGFTLVAVLTLALAIGANTAIFSMIYGVLWSPLPYPEPDRLVRFFESSSKNPHFPIAPGNLPDYRERNRTFSELAVYTRGDLELSGDGQPERLKAMAVSTGFFTVLGFAPKLGRTFTPEEAITGKDRVVVLSEGLWSRRFASDPQIVGKPIQLNRKAHTVIGVMPAGVQHVGGAYRSLPHGETVELWWPITFGPEKPPRYAHYTNGIGRLRPGVTVAQAQADLDRILKELIPEAPVVKGWDSEVVSLNDEILGRSRKPLLALLGAVGLVLLVACVNIANLLLARASGKRQELAVRQALGASRGQLIGQLMAESLLLAAIGGGIGLLLARWGIAGLVALAPSTLPRVQEIGLNTPVLLFTVVVTFLTGLLFGLLPAWQGSRTDPRKGLVEGGARSGGSTRANRLRGVLVTAEVALSCLLLIGGALLLRSFVRLQQSDPGFQSEGVLTFRVTLPRAGYQKQESINAFLEQFTTRLRQLPQVRAAGVGTDLPWTGYDENAGVEVEGRMRPGEGSPMARYHAASPGYFQAVGMPLLAGRFFSEEDRDGKQKVLIVNRAFASRLLAGEDPIGKRVKIFGNEWLQIVGLVGDVKDAPTSASALPAFWWPAQQMLPSNELAVAVRAGGDAAGLVNAAREVLGQLDRSLPMADIRMLDRIADESVAAPRFTLLLVLVFAVAALTLAAVGTFGVLSYLVTQRFYEFGVRMALGAQAGDVMRLVVGQGLQWAFAGVALGVAGALAMARIWAGLLYEVSPRDPVTITIVSVVALIVTAAASTVPAWRATRVDPVSALRSE